jgi:hypothetical protein
VSESPDGHDFFDHARLFAAGGLFLAGGLAIAGCFLAWVTFSLGEPASFRNDHGPPPPILGIQVSDWKVVLMGGLVVVVCAILLASRKRSLYAWISFIASIIIGAIAVADYRGLGDPTSGFIRGLENSVHANLHGEAHPGIGLTLVAIGGVGGLIASVIGIAATPHRAE